MTIKLHRKFLKQLRKAPREIQAAFDARLELFVSNPGHPLLRNHALTGNYLGYRSINITGDWRAIYKEVDSILDDPFVVFVDLGTHSQLYR